jgi:heptosyltransferase-3
MFDNSAHSSPKILIIRREYIGDLVCTTPLISTLRSRFPNAHIACLVNSYNIHVLDGNPDVDEVYAYIKPRHRLPEQSVVGSWFTALRLYVTLLATHFDYVVLATTDFLKKDVDLIRSLRPKHIVALASGKNPTNHVDILAQLDENSGPLHIVEELATLAKPFGITFQPPPMRVFPDTQAVALATLRLAQAGLRSEDSPVGLHISSRAPSQRWPASRFIELIHRLHAQYQSNIMVFWSPGDEQNPLHPGDDRKALEILDAVRDLPVVGYPTRELRDLIAGLSICSSVICSDGGAMHIAAALGKPIVCFFGPSDAVRWHPWRVPHVLLQTKSKLVSDISVEAALSAHECLLQTREVQNGILHTYESMVIRHE